MVACSLTLGIGGSGGVFAPSLFIGVTSGMAFGVIADHVFGPGAGQPALYAVVAMGAVFTSAARAPLTSVASVVELTGDFTLTLPVMLAVAIATATSRALSYGTIYTTKLLRRGQDIDRAAPWRPFQDLKAADAMRPFQRPLAVAAGTDGDASPAAASLGLLPGPVTYSGDPQAVFASESLAQVLRQLEAHGRDGLPVLSGDGQQVQGWITNASVLQAVAHQIGGTRPQATHAHAAARSRPDPEPARPQPPSPLPGYQVLEITLGEDSPASGQALAAITWPPGCTPVSVLRNRKPQDPHPALTLASGDRVNLLARASQWQRPRLPASAPGTSAGQGTRETEKSYPPESTAQKCGN